MPVSSQRLLPHIASLSESGTAQIPAKYTPRAFNTAPNSSCLRCARGCYAPREHGAFRKQGLKYSQVLLPLACSIFWRNEYTPMEMNIKARDTETPTTTGMSCFSSTGSQLEAGGDFCLQRYRRQAQIHKDTWASNLHCGSGPQIRTMTCTSKLM
ncbi:hypothetical protein KIL84_021874 [Mauremys mutica]|uniref:Uncharacterized protein n=1 Tax=Mauremys mutica TaxID=74926 RepID=A0A9D3XGJ9_9SAUR|nr:hypothetical protein KIL84_021874 [Mauremys mutica]